MSNYRNSECFKALKQVMNRNKIEFDVEFGGKHPKIVFDVEGSTRRLTFPSSSSDWRAARNLEKTAQKMIDEVKYGNDRKFMCA